MYDTDTIQTPLVFLLFMLPSCQWYANGMKLWNETGDADKKRTQICILGTEIWDDNVL